MDKEADVPFPVNRKKDASPKGLTEQLDPPREAVDVDERPQGLGDVHTAEEQHGAGAVDPVEHSALLVHPEGDDGPLVGELLRQRLGPEAALRDQVRAGVLGQGVGVDPRRVLAGEAEPQGAAPAALLLSYLEDILGSINLKTHQTSVAIASRSWGVLSVCNSF